MPRPATQRIWLTGATSGIGRALALRLLAQGRRVALSARGEGALAQLTAGYDNALALPLDVTDRDAVARAGERLADAFGGLDLALLNAGTCEYLEVHDFDAALVERVFTVNVFGTIHCIEAALPLLRRARAQGHHPLLAATSSAAAYLPLPGPKPTAPPRRH